MTTINENRLYIPPGQQFQDTATTEQPDAQDLAKWNEASNAGEGLTPAEGGSPTTKQAAINKKDDSRWPGGVVPYVLDPNLDPQERQQVLDGIGMIENQTNISFVPLPDIDGNGVPDGEAPDNFIRFQQSADGSSSHVGMQEGEQVILTSSQAVDPTTGRNGEGTVAHEIMHALGFYHEHQHPDVNNPGNPVTVTPSATPGPNFRALPDDAVILPYDPDSIMHYPPVNQTGGNITGGPDAGNVGQRFNLSTGDINAINHVYSASDILKGGIEGLKSISDGLGANTGIPEIGKFETATINLEIAGNQMMADPTQENVSLFKEAAHTLKTETDKLKGVIGDTLYEGVTGAVNKFVAGVDEAIKLSEAGNIEGMNEQAILAARSLNDLTSLVKAAINSG